MYTRKSEKLGHFRQVIERKLGKSEKVKNA